MALCRTLSLRGVRSKTLLILQKSCKHNKKCLLKKNTDKRERTYLCEELTLMTHTAFICSNYSHEKKSKIRIVWWQLCYFVVGWVGFGGFLHWGEHTEGWGVLWMCSLRGRGRLGLACLTVEFYCCHHSTLYLKFYKSASIHYFTRNDNHFTTYIPLQSVSLFWNIPYRTRANKGRSLYSKIIFPVDHYGMSL